MPNLDWLWGAAAAVVVILAGISLLSARPKKTGRAPTDGRIFPDDPPPVPPEDEESLDVWGFKDTRFFVNDRERVEVSGSRYELSGVELPRLGPWVREVTGAELSRQDMHRPAYPPAVPDSRFDPALAAELRRCLNEDQISLEPLIRLRHGHGHTQEEMYALRYGGFARVPDVVVYPEDDEQVSELVRAAVAHDACLIPYGGGTNVTEALRCPEDERRTIVSVDMSRMNRVLWIDPANRMACIQAGAVGRHIMEQLAEYGFTMGHEPDSVEFSTLGGWIATQASGMKKNRYGNIEDLVLDVQLVTPGGRIERSAVAPRESVGADPRRWALGSEGNLGIITGAVVKIFPLPEVQRYGSVVFRSFEEGVAFLYDLSRTGDTPASVRLVDNVQFQFSVALKPETNGLRWVKGRLEKWVVTKLFRYDPEKMVACTLVFEGSRTDVERQEETVYRIARQHGGMKAGGENGRRGYQLTFSIAYIRDFIMQHWLLGESFETSVPWSQTLELCENVKRRVRDEHARRGLPGRPFISCRVTQIYPNGVCVYFYMGFLYKGVERASEVYAEIEAAAREEILRSGGSLSHHHGIGKLRQRFLPDIMSPAGLDWSRRTKRAIDPKNVFGSRNQGVV